MGDFNIFFIIGVGKCLFIEQIAKGLLKEA